MLPFNNPMVVRTDNGDLVDRGSHSLELILFRSLRQRILMVALDVALIKIPVGLSKSRPHICQASPYWALPASPRQGCERSNRSRAIRSFRRRRDQGGAVPGKFPGDHSTATPPGTGDQNDLLLHASEPLTAGAQLSRVISLAGQARLEP